MAERTMLPAGRCLVIDSETVTRESLLAQGLSEAAADELLAFAERLRARQTRAALATLPPAGAR